MKKYTNYLLIVILAFSFQVSAQQILTKKEAITIALENNYGIKLAKNAVKTAKNNSSIYNSRMLPSINTTAGTNFNTSNQDIERQDGSQLTFNDAETKSYNASVNLNYTLFDGMGRMYNYKQLKETYNLSELQAKATIENTYLNLFTVYYQIARLSESKKNLKEALEISKQRLVRAEYQYEYGKSTKLEVLNATVDVNNDSINLINTVQLYRNAKRDLNTILVKKTDINYSVDTKVDFAPIFSFEELYNSALKNNTLLMQQEKNISISKLALKNTQSTYFPTIGLSSSYGWNKSINPASSFLAGSVITGLNLGVNLTWNLFDGGNTKTRVANSKIALENQQIIKEQQTDNLKNTLQNAWDDYNNKLFIVKAQKQNVLTSQNNFDRTNERYKLGQVSSIEFRQAQVNLLNSKTAANNAIFDAKLAELQLFQLSGELLNIRF